MKNSSILTKTAAAILSGTLLFGGVGIFASAEGSSIIGDVSSDGVVNAKDITLLRRYLSGQDVEIDLTLADTNNDYVINAKDVTQLKRTVAGQMVDNGVMCGFRPIKDGTHSTIHYYCAYKSDKSVFDIDDVTLDFYFGGYYLYDDYEINREYQSYPVFDLCFSTVGATARVKTIEENFVSEKYSVDLVLTEDGKYLDEVKYKHFETLTIPKELFNEQSDYLTFYIWGVNEKDPNNGAHLLRAINIYYSLVGDKVTLSSKAFN